MNTHLEHCLWKIAELVAKGDGGRRSCSQLGYNLGRLGELSGLGRGPCWDRWKGAILDWDRPQLVRLVQELRKDIEALDATEEFDVQRQEQPARP